MLLNEDLPDGWRLVASPPDYADDLERLVIGHDRERHTVAWCEIEHDDGTRVALRVAPRDAADTSAGGVITDFTLSAGNRADGVQRLHALPFNEIMRRANARLAEDHQAFRAAIAAITAGWTPQDDGRLPPFSRHDDFYRSVAAVWLAAFNEGDESPTARVEAAASPRASSATARRWVAEARKRGFIPAGLVVKPGPKRS